MKIDLRNGDCTEVLKEVDDNSVDLVITSPPYDNLRTYEETLLWNFDKFTEVAHHLWRVFKDGGVVIWVVGDQTVDGSETGTSFKQALYFMGVGFNLHDTMIYRKENYVPLTHNRYEQEFEYMFCFSKGKPKTFNPIMIPCKWAGTESWGEPTMHKTNNSGLVSIGKTVIKDEKQHGNIFSYRVGSVVKVDGNTHPAVFPEELVKDQLLTWSNEGDIVLDPFMGSGTTGKMSILHNRNFIGIELVEDYFNMAKDRIYAQKARIGLWELL